MRGKRRTLPSLRERMSSYTPRDHARHCTCAHTPTSTKSMRPCTARSPGMRQKAHLIKGLGLSSSV